MKFCRLHRTVAALWLDAPAGVPALARRHVEQCPACRAALAQERELHRQLGTPDVRNLPPVNPFLNPRILAHLAAPSAAEGETPAFFRGHSMAILAAGCTAALAALIVAVQLWRPGSPDGATTAVPLSAATERWVAHGLTHWESLVEQPLHDEMRLAVLDGEAALVSLVHRFVPAATARQFLDHTRAFLPSAHLQDAPLPSTRQPARKPGRQ